MSDIFGKTTYRQYEDLRKAGYSPEQYVRDNWENVPATHGKDHNFQAMGPSETRNVQGSSPLGYLTDNLVAIQAQVEEVLRIEARFERFTPLKTDIPEGAQTFGVPVTDAVGDAGFIDNRGTDAQSVSISAELVTGQVRVGGNIATYSDEELRAAMFAGMPLQTMTVDSATRRCMRHIERVAFNGHGDNKGILNQTTGTGTDRVRRTAAAKTFDNSNGLEIAKEITDEIGAMVDDTNEVIGEAITGEIVIALPPIQYNRIKSLVVTDTGTDLSVAEHVMRHNGWTDEAVGNTIRFERLNELKTAGSSNSTRMLVLLRSPRIVEFPVAIMPRVKTAIRHEYGVNVPLEYKIGLGAFVKRPAGIRYVDGV